MKSKLNFLIIPMLAFLFAACTKKQESTDKNFYGKVNVSQAGVSDAPILDVYFENEKLGTVLPTGGTSSFTFLAGKTGTLSIYKASTDTLVADTLITIIKNSTIDIRVIYSDLLGIKGFLTSETNIGADSVKLQFMYTFDSPFYPYSVLDLHILKGADREDIGVVIKGLESGQLNSQTVTLLHYDIETESGIIYYGILKDPTTGETIKMKYKDRDYFTVIPRDASYNGALSIVQIYDDEGDETNNKIATAVTKL